MSQGARRVDGQVAVVTGARGIGRAVAAALGSEGARVVLVDVSEQFAAEAASLLQRAGTAATALSTNVADRDAARSVVARVRETFGRLDILVNAAGIGKREHFLEITPANWRRHFEVHVDGTLYMSQASAEVMAAAGYGRIVNIASVAGYVAGPEMAPYVAAKHAVLGLTKAAALDLAESGITVNAIAPGPIDTQLSRENMTPEEQAARAEHLPVARLGRTDEVGQAALFLSLPSSSFITGTVLTIDGGSLAVGPYMVEVNRRRRSRR